MQRVTLFNLCLFIWTNHHCSVAWGMIKFCRRAGKSFRFRQLLRVLCTSQSNCDSGSGSSLDTPLLAGVAVLEAFGTCRTKQNADSSRFGKYLRLKMQVSRVHCDFLWECFPASSYGTCIWFACLCVCSATGWS